MRKLYLVFVGNNYYPRACGGDLVNVLHVKTDAIQTAREKLREEGSHAPYTWASVTEIDPDLDGRSSRHRIIYRTWGSDGHEEQSDDGDGLDARMRLGA